MVKINILALYFNICDFRNNRYDYRGKDEHGILYSDVILQIFILFIRISSMSHREDSLYAHHQTISSKLNDIRIKMDMIKEENSKISQNRPILSAHPSQPIKASFLNETLEEQEEFRKYNKI